MHFIKYIYHTYIYIYIYIHTHTHTYISFSMLDKGLRKHQKKKVGEIGKHKLNEMGTLNIK